MTLFPWQRFPLYADGRWKDDMSYCGECGGRLVWGGMGWAPCPPARHAERRVRLLHRLASDVLVVARKAGVAEAAMPRNPDPGELKMTRGMILNGNDTQP